MCQYCTAAEASQGPAPQERVMEREQTTDTPLLRLALNGPAAGDKSPSGAVTRALADGRLRTAVA